MKNGPDRPVFYEYHVIIHENHDFSSHVDVHEIFGLVVSG